MVSNVSLSDRWSVEDIKVAEGGAGAGSPRVVETLGFRVDKCDCKKK